MRKYHVSTVGDYSVYTTRPRVRQATFVAYRNNEDGSVTELGSSHDFISALAIISRDSSRRQLGHGGRRLGVFARDLKKAVLG